MYRRSLVAGCLAIASAAFISAQSAVPPRPSSGLGLDPNIQSETGRTALHGAGHKGRTAVIQMLVDHGARLDPAITG